MALKAAGKVPSNFQFSGSFGTAAIQAGKHDDEDEEKRLPRFTGRAYNGGIMTVAFFGPIVVDLAGLSVTAKQRPMLKDHNERTPVGHTTSLTGSGNGITIGTDFIDVEGVFSIESEERDLIVNGAKNDFEWQLSIGANPTKLIFVDEDTMVEVNGQEFEGPLVVAREAELKEISFLPLGADDDTTSKVAAHAANFKKESEMTFKQWLKACNHDESKLSKDDLKLLKATFEGIQAAEAAAKIEADKATPEPTPTPEPTKIQAATSVDIAKITADIQASLLEANKIAALCSGNVELHEKAIKAGWDSERIETELKITKLEAQRDSNVGGFNFGMGGSSDMQPNDMEIAILRAGGYSDEKIIKEFGQEAIEASDKRFGRRLGLQESMSIMARMNGYSGPAHSFKSDERGIFAAAMMIQGATSFSTLGGLNGVFANVANKRFQEGFMNVEQVWREVTAFGTVTDFKETSKFTLTGDFKFRKIGAGGELKHGKVGTEKYTNQADTSGILFGINRHNLINDDLDVLSTVPNRMGRGAGIEKNEVFWAAFLANTAFFTAGRKNLTTGNALSIAELRAMNTAFRLLKDPDGKPMNASAGILLTGVENESLGMKLFGDDKIVSGNTTAQLDGNEHKGKFRPLSSAYISDTSIGGDATQSYLLANPLSMAVIEVVHLNGVQEPVVESQNANFDTLGIDFRAYHDFGVNLQEHRAGVRSNGV